MKDFHYVYILESISQLGHYYTGSTNNIAERLKKQNEGGCPHLVFNISNIFLIFFYLGSLILLLNAFFVYAKNIEYWTVNRCICRGK